MPFFSVRKEAKIELVEIALRVNADAFSAVSSSSDCRAELVVERHRGWRILSAR